MRDRWSIECWSWIRDTSKLLKVAHRYRAMAWCVGQPA
jgi:hypothetical protein